MPKLITIYWRDIPAQVMGRARGDKHRVELSQRFQVAIDRAAMRAGRGSSDAYLEDWRRVTEMVTGDLAKQVRQRADELEAAFDDERLERIVKAGGVRADAEDAAGD